MQALVYRGPGRRALDERPMPAIAQADDAIVRLARTTICGTDLHILKGDVPTCQPGTTLGHEGVAAHGRKVDLHLERLWSHNIAITTRLVDTVTVPRLMKAVTSHRLEPAALVTHRFDFADMERAYDTFGRAAETGAMKVVIRMP